MRLINMKPDRAYLSADMFLPVERVHLPSVQKALDFWVEDANDPEGGYWLRQWELVGQHVRVPRYFIPQEEYPNLGYQVVDIRRHQDTGHLFTSTIDPSEARTRGQAPIMRSFEAVSYGTLNLSCGKGKTVMALHKIAYAQQRAVIVLNNTGILEQWAKEIPKFLEFDGGVGRVQGKEFDWEHPIVLAMIQTLSRRGRVWPEEFRRYFGMAIFDEAHHVSAPEFSRAANLFYGDRYALTATAERTDGNERIYQFHLGEVFYRDLSQDLVPTVYFYRTGVDFPKHRNGKVHKKVLQAICPKRAKKTLQNVHHGMLCRWLGAHSVRNAIVLKEIADARDKGRKILALSHSKDHVKMLHSMLPGAGLLTGDTKQAEILAQLHDYPVVFATMGKGREGLDRDELDTLMYLTPFRNANDYQQSTGRALRSRSGKKEVVVIYFEDEIGISRAAGREIRKLARKHKHKVEVLT